MDELRELVAIFMDNDEEFTMLENENWYNMEDKLYNFLTNNKYKIHRLVDREFHKEDVLQEIEDRNQEIRDEFADEDKELTIDVLLVVDEQTIEELTDYYEDYLGDGSYDWRCALNFAFEKAGIER